MSIFLMQMRMMKIKDLCKLAGITEQTLSTHFHVLIASLFDDPHSYLNAPEDVKEKVANFIHWWKISDEEKEQ